jgi:DNA-binding LacI/PurR family transcriptional regulator
MVAPEHDEESPQAPPRRDAPSAPAAGQPRPPAMTDVARFVGVSHQTVSRVINNHPNVRPQTRARVLAAMQELGYRPNTAARTLATGRSRTLGVVTLPGTLYGPSSTLYAIEQAAWAADYQVSVVRLRSVDQASVRQAVARLVTQSIEGVIAITPLLVSGEALSQVARTLPFVAVEGNPEGDLSIVSVDQEAGARRATQHLLAAGHATVWHVAGPHGWYEAAGRVAGWRQALEDAGAKIPLTLTGDWTPSAGFEAGQILARTSEATAIFVANDQMALGVLRALREHGRRVPEDVSVVGFDDIPEAGYFSPPLTTIRQDFASVGRASLRSLIDQIESGKPSSTRVVIPPDLVVRDSTAPPPT